MALSDSHTPSREMAFAGGPTIERLTPATITVTSGNLLNIPVTLKPSFGGFVFTLAFSLNVQE